MSYHALRRLSARVRKVAKILPSIQRQMVTVRTNNSCKIFVNLISLCCLFSQLQTFICTLNIFLSHFLTFPEIFVPLSFWPASSVALWTVYWPHWEGVMSVFGRCAHPSATASPPPCSLSWMSLSTVTYVDAWAFASVNVNSVISAFRLQSAWTSLWKSLRCFITDAGNKQAHPHKNNWKSFIC